MTRRGSARRTAWIAGAGVAAGVMLGFAGAHFAFQRQSPAPAVTPQAAAPASVPAAAATPAPAVEVVPASASAASSATSGLQPASATMSAPPVAAKPAPAAASVDARLAAGRELLSSAEAGYSVQLMVTDARSRSYLEHYLAEAARNVKPDAFYLVPTGSPDTPRLGLLLGHYQERGEAVAALDALPESLRQFRPYVRTLDAVRDDARHAAAAH
jgi:septal ring-binding cell division protein DamX